MASPGTARDATPHSSERSSGAATLSNPSPLLHRDDRALADLRLDVKLVHQASRTRQPQTQPARGGVPILQGAGDIADARSLVLGNDDHTDTVIVIGETQADLAALGV